MDLKYSTLTLNLLCMMGKTNASYFAINCTCDFTYCSSVYTRLSILIFSQDNKYETSVIFFFTYYSIKLEKISYFVCCYYYYHVLQNNVICVLFCYCTNQEYLVLCAISLLCVLISNASVFLFKIILNLIIIYFPILVQLMYTS